MSTFDADIRDPGVINWRRFCRNGTVTSGMMEKRIRDATNHIVAFRRKAASFWTTPTVRTGISGTNRIYSTAIRAGYGVQELEAVLVLLPADNASAADPYAFLRVTDGFSGGSQTDSNELHYSRVETSGGDIPDNIFYGKVSVAVTENTYYRVDVMAVDYARVIGACIWERGYDPVDDTYGGAVDPRVHKGVQILDSNTANLADEQLLLWNRNQAPFISWCEDRVGDDNFTITATSYTNLFDGSSTSVTTTTPGFMFDAAYRGSLSSTTIPVVFAIRAAITAGAGTATVRLTDGTNNIDIGSVSGVATWYSTTGTIPTGDDQKWDIHVDCSNGTTTCAVEAAVLFPED